jgi:tRNA pseudouridine55 synthase
MPDGILNLDKPRGPTSHDIVDRVRALIGIRRVGHAGTLDPLATGVLIVCVGRATRVAEYLMVPEYGARKVYRARVRLGIATDTYDAEGRVVAEAPVDVTRAQVDAVLVRFRGTVTQVPPMHSALKKRGVPLYRLARRGVEVARDPRQVEVYCLELTACEPPELVLDITCSPGTYVRALAHDLGQALGCGAHLSALTRLASGGFRLDDAITMDALTRAVSGGSWCEFLHPMDAALYRFPKLQLDAGAARRLCLGQAVPTSGARLVAAKRVERIDVEVQSSSVNEELCDRGDVRGTAEGPMPAAASLARAYGPEGAFLAVVARDLAGGVWRPRKVFCTPE